MLDARSPGERSRGRLALNIDLRAGVHQKGDNETVQTCPG